MTPYYEDGQVVLYHGDCREVIPSEVSRVAVTITSPPYWNARTYEGIGWATYADHLAFVREVLVELEACTGWLVWIAGYIWKDGSVHDCAGDAARLAEHVGFSWRQQVPWVKEDYAPQPSIDLAPAHEPSGRLPPPLRGPAVRPPDTPLRSLRSTVRQQCGAGDLMGVVWGSPSRSRSASGSHPARAWSPVIRRLATLGLAALPSVGRRQAKLESTRTRDDGSSR